MKPKKIKAFTFQDIGLSRDEYSQLRQLGLKHQGDAWDTRSKKSPLDDSEKKLVKKFKSELKDYLYTTGQGRYCCYCGIELQSHNATYDIEHVIAKDGRGSVVFHLNNLALSCKVCNTNKGLKCVTSAPSDADCVWKSSDKYKLIHPQLDSWAAHLELDGFRRVRPKTKSGKAFNKASKTIEICMIERLNAARIADGVVWGKDEKKRWEMFYVSLYVDDKKESRKRAEFLKSLAESGTDPLAKKLYNLLSPELPFRR